MSELNKLDDKQLDEMEALTEAVTSTVKSEIKGVHENLQDALKKGLSPIDQKVVDLEKKLIESEAKQKEMEESIRLQAARQIAGGDGKREQDLFKGVFFKDFTAVRDIMRQSMSVGEDNSRSINSATTINTAGKLTAEQAETFLDYAIQQQVALSRVSTRRMNSPQGLTDEIRVAARKLRKATEGTTQAVSDAVSFKRRTMTTVEVIWTEDITLSFLEDNIERAGAEGHIARLLANQFGNDLNDLAWNGDDSLTTTAVFHTINKGWFKLASADSDVTKLDFATTASGGPFTTSNTAVDALKLIWKNLPVKFKGRPDMLFWCSIPFAEAYANMVAARLTQLGDQTLIAGLPSLRYFGMPLVPEPHFTGTTTPDLSGDKIMFTPAANLFHGIQRSITVDSMWQPRLRVVEYTITARNDYEYGTGEAIVTAKGLPSNLR